jgi:hypothetical protein
MSSRRLPATRSGKLFVIDMAEAPPDETIPSSSPWTHWPPESFPAFIVFISRLVERFTGLS